MKGNLITSYFHEEASFASIQILKFCLISVFLLYTSMRAEHEWKVIYRSGKYAKYLTEIDNMSYCFASLSKIFF